MAQITAISVRFKEGRKLEDYGDPRVVDLTANVILDAEDDANEAIARTIGLLRSHVRFVLTGKDAPAVRAPANTPPVTPAKAPAPEQEPAPAPADELGEPDIDEPETEVDLGEPETETAEPAITDADLNSATGKKVKEVGTDKIKSLIWSFRPEGHTGTFASHKIPQERRQEYLDKLAALGKNDAGVAG